MSGHSKWATIKRKKGALDAKKGKIYTKLVREITTAARIGGGSPEGNPRLRAAIVAAKAERMPSDNIDRAIKKGTGELEGAQIEDSLYEGYGPGGVAILVEAQTDNKNRTSAEVRAVFTKNNGNMGASGSVSYMFKERGQIAFDGKRFSEDELMEVALEAGAEDVQVDGEQLLVVTEPRAFAKVLDAVDKKKLTYERAELVRVPDNTVKIAGDQVDGLMRLIERLEDLDDVQKVWANFDIDDADLERMAAQG